ncbi:hypothetical protein KKH82_00005, partial [Patescibacteria group bacterium]|nr:hypothetical protein [Patescibacteria group bacterium]
MSAQKNHNAGCICSNHDSIHSSQNSLTTSPQALFTKVFLRVFFDELEIILDILLLTFSTLSIFIPFKSTFAIPANLLVPTAICDSHLPIATHAHIVAKVIADPIIISFARLIKNSSGEIFPSNNIHISDLFSYLYICPLTTISDFISSIAKSTVLKVITPAVVPTIADIAIPQTAKDDQPLGIVRITATTATTMDAAVVTKV